LSVDNRTRFRLAGVGFGAAAAIWGAVQGDWWFALIFAVATVFTGITVVYEWRRSQGR
jgi:hypothetical protein